METPSQITVIVYSARHLQSHRKGDECHASVVFGHGKDFYTTEVVESNEPEWNQEASLLISSHHHEPVKFKVKDREHTLGVVSLPLSDLSNHRNKVWLPLQPHKRSHEAYGELQVGCWVTSYHPRDTVSPGTSRASSQEELPKSKLSRGPFSFHRRSPSWSRTRPERHSMYEKPSNAHGGPGQGASTQGEQRVLRSFQSDTNLRSGGEEEEPEEQRGISKSSTDHSLADNASSTGEGESGYLPEVTGVSPNEGSVEGGERVILRGSNLGESRADIVQVVVAGVDCTQSVEYFSPSKLVVVTMPRAAPGSGPVMVETLRGGVGVSWINFTFVQKGPATTESSLVAKKSRMEPDSSLQVELKSYKQQVRDLKERNKALSDENEQLKNYIDNLLVAVIEQTPDVLEIKRPTSAPALHTTSVHGFTQ